jgi:hypothetical protein
VSSLIGKSKYLSFFCFFLYQILLFFSFLFFPLFLSSYYQQRCNTKKFRGNRGSKTLSAETNDKIAQSVKLMFENCEAKVGNFPALFGHGNISVTGKSGEIQM